MGKVYLVGAGPGDIELLTLKAHRLIKEAQMIVYDRLANPEILKKAPKNCKIVNVGKTDGHHLVKQEKINEILHKAALTHDNVIRLKGGDPFVFGRGGEEALYLKEKGIAFEIVPGISSCIAVPSYAGIPLTQRGMVSSFRVITGHECNKKSSQIDWESCKSDETLVFLMGLHKMNNIVTNLLNIGKDARLPVAVISQGTTISQQVVVGNLDNIAHKAKHLPTPALIIVGEVINLRERLNWFK